MLAALITAILFFLAHPAEVRHWFHDHDVRSKLVPQDAEGGVCSIPASSAESLCSTHTACKVKVSTSVFSRLHVQYSLGKECEGRGVEFHVMLVVHM